MQREYIPRMINLERTDYQVVKRMSEERGFGDKGFSAALRMIIREWQEFQLRSQRLAYSDNMESYARIIYPIATISPVSPSVFVCFFTMLILNCKSYIMR